MVLTNVSGDLAFTNLDIFADGGAGLRMTGTGAFTGSAGMQIAVGAGVAIFEAIGGPAVDVTNATIDLQLSSIKSTNSATDGRGAQYRNRNLLGGLGQQHHGNITSAAGTAFQVGSSSATVQLRRDDQHGHRQGCRSSPAIPARRSALPDADAQHRYQHRLQATGGGTVTATDTASTLTTTTGTALNVANTTIGAGGLKFRSISAGTAASGPANGIVLNTTGSLGGLTVSGTGSAGSGGTIQKATGQGFR